jgi:transcriptional regulator with XRE-family HTH domain
MTKTPGQVMQAARLAHKPEPLTQDDIAKLCEVTQPLVARWESDKAPVPANRIRRAARAYGVKPEQLIPPDDAA